MQPTALDRWILHPIRSGLMCALFFGIGAYLFCCLVHGVSWTTEFSPTYGLAIIRLAFGVVLGIISSFTLPFAAGEMILSVGMYVLPISFGIGFLYRLVFAVQPDETPGVAGEPESGAVAFS